MAKFLFALTLAPLLVACKQEPPPDYTANICDRRELFALCMQALPAGPVSTKYSDWDEVVEACDSVSYKQSRMVLSKQQPQSCERAHRESQITKPSKQHSSMPY